ncbi:uncharacterized protein LOC117107466 isoform X1 [Anneissia japonica]|uniref:uncharacterized protein LOC117107466 isoform X1 n=1 Tax=Anneissia japonica TaxID=1529436 RepID=UPI0014258785|nr:uncharacterized protein LOC117107466 isoform X1 [Anneissia japonica]
MHAMVFFSVFSQKVKTLYNALLRNLLHAPLHRRADPAWLHGDTCFLLCSLLLLSEGAVLRVFHALRLQIEDAVLRVSNALRLQIVTPIKIHEKESRWGTLQNTNYVAEGQDCEA